MKKEKLVRMIKKTNAKDIVVILMIKRQKNKLTAFSLVDGSKIEKLHTLEYLKITKKDIVEDLKKQGVSIEPELPMFR